MKKSTCKELTLAGNVYRFSKDLRSIYVWPVGRKGERVRISKVLLDDKVMAKIQEVLG